MKDYRNIASSYGVVCSYMDTDDFISSYKINPENKYVEIKYLSGHSKVEELQKETKEILDFKQQLQFREMKDKLEPDIDSRIRWQGTIFLFDATSSLLQFTTGNWLAGTCCY